jgi:Flp pilus assembly pilin Flp
MARELNGTDLARRRRARRVARGAVSVEYVVLLATCGLVISTAIVALGPAIATAYQQNRQIVIAPVP